MQKSRNRYVVNRQIVRVGTLLLLVLQLYSCRAEKAPPQAESTRPAIRLAELPISYSTMTHLASILGYYDDQGIDFRSISVPAGPDVVTALKGQQSDSANVGSIAVTPVITMISSGDKPVVIATLLKSNTQAKLVTFEANGITDDPRTLRGKRIGVTLNTNGDIYLSRLLKKGGLGNDDVAIVNARPADLRNLILQDELDAVVLWDPFVVQIVRQYSNSRSSGSLKERGGPKVLVDPSLHTLAFNLVTTREKLASSRNGLIRMLRALIKTEQFVADDRLGAKRRVEEWLRLESGDLDDFFDSTEFHVYLDISEMKKWMKEELEWLSGRRPDAIVPEQLSEYIDPALLREIDPTRVID